MQLASQTWSYPGHKSKETAKVETMHRSDQIPALRDRPPLKEARTQRMCSIVSCTNWMLSRCQTCQAKSNSSVLARHHRLKEARQRCSVTMIFSRAITLRDSQRCLKESDKKRLTTKGCRRNYPISGGVLVFARRALRRVAGSFWNYSGMAKLKLRKNQKSKYSLAHECLNWLDLLRLFN